MIVLNCSGQALLTLTKRHLLFVIYLVLPFFSYCQWNWMNPLPQGNHLQSVRFINPSMGFSVGDGGTVLKTTDGGQSWKRLYAGTPSNLTAVFFFNPDTGYVTSENYLFKTTDGGLNWNMGSTYYWGMISDIWFTDNDTGYFCGEYGTGLYKTTNGGTTWIMSTSIPTSECASLFFIDAQTFYGIGAMGIYKTTNGGNTWVTSYQAPVNGFLTDLYFTTPDTGYASCTGGMIVRTTDAGST
ncbi:MAG: YCF48-related protein [Bacteroidota bacterium]